MDVTINHGGHFTPISAGLDSTDGQTNLELANLVPFIQCITFDRKHHGQHLSHAHTFGPLSFRLGDGDSGQMGGIVPALLEGRC